MRIKYRIFSECGMYYPDEEPPCNGVLSHLTLTQNGFVCEMTFPHDAEIEYYTGPDAYVMLWTGVKDRNGKDIYDGDIVEWAAEHGVLRCVIEWDEKRPSYNMRRYMNGVRCNYSIPLFASYAPILTVLGNIHEDEVEGV